MLPAPGSYSLCLYSGHHFLVERRLEIGPGTAPRGELATAGAEAHAAHVVVREGRARNAGATADPVAAWLFAALRFAN